jgi:hypothetical protein
MTRSLACKRDAHDDCDGIMHARDDEARASSSPNEPAVERCDCTCHAKPIVAPGGQQGIDDAEAGGP